MKINFARLNHVFIPATKEGRDRLRRGRLGRVLAPFFYLYESLSPEGGAFFVAALLCGVLGLEVSANEVHAVWGCLTALLLVSLLCARRYRLRGVGLRVLVPRRVSVGDPLTFTLVARNDGAVEHQALQFLGPFLPWDGHWDGDAAPLPVLPPGAEGRVEAHARFVARGEHHLDPFRVAALAPLGLALGPSVYSDGCRFLVVPRIANVRQVTTPLGTRHQPGGVALASRTGESMELLGVRPYRAGDPVRDLHARSWARVGAPVVREYRQEYFSRIGIVLDTDVAAAPEQDEEVLEGAISLAAGIIGKLTQGEALIDLLVVGRTVHSLTLGRSLGTFEQALDLLACVQPGPAFSADLLLQQLQPHIGRLSCVLFIALSWDPARARLAGRIRSGGTGCAAVVVTPEAQPPGPATDLHRVSLAALQRGEPLHL